MTEPQASEAPERIEYARPDRALKPIYLFADSQLLFWKPEGRPFMESVAARLDATAPSAAYIGASNGDDPAYYAIFEAAMDEIGITDRRQIPSEPEAEDLVHLDTAELILLAGGDVERGWRTFERNGLKQILVRRYYEGALLIGISAGAVQLGLGARSEEGGETVHTFRLLPHLVGAHQEDEHWDPLKQAVSQLGGHARGYGVPAGGGFAYHPDHVIEPLRLPLLELRLEKSEIRQSLLLPGESDENDDVDENENDDEGEETVH